MLLQTLVLLGKHLPEDDAHRDAERMRRNAETELKAAISLDENNATYRVMLAELYSEIGLLRRAQAELQHALTIDPKNQTARRLLDKLKR